MQHCQIHSQMTMGKCNGVSNDNGKMQLSQIHSQMTMEKCNSQIHSQMTM